MTSNGDAASSEDLLYHVVYEIIDYHKDTSGTTRTINVFGTFTSLPVAKVVARSLLKNWGYSVSDFEIYEVNTNPENWKYGDGVALYAKARSGQEFRVRLDTKPNPNQLKGDKEGVVEGHLHYVLQTKIEYINQVWAKQVTEIEGAFSLRKDAIDAAYSVLLDPERGLTREQYAVYEEKDTFKDKWPFGDDTFVHAVTQNGDTFLVEVKTESKTPPQRDL